MVRGCVNMLRVTLDVLSNSRVLCRHASWMSGVRSTIVAP
jgi:hypothetical protein